MTNQERFAALLYKIMQEKDLSQQEVRELEEFVQIAPQYQKLLDGARNSDTYWDWYRAYVSDVEFLEGQATVKPVDVVRMRRIRWLSLAAAVLVICSLGYWHFSNASREKLAGNEKEAPAEILPAVNKARLVLGNNRVIDLDDIQAGVIATDDGIPVVKSEDGFISYKGSKGGGTVKNTLITPYGGFTKAVLPDGSKVWLNAGSTLTYPVEFSGNDRMVELLEGQAYFEVVKDPGKPFIVEFGKQQVRVLGTRFDISFYQNDSLFRATLLEGSVKVQREETTQKNNVTLNPGEQAVMFAASNMAPEVRRLGNPDAVIGWVNSASFYFDAAPIAEITRTLERWYNVKFEFDNADTLSRSDSFSGEFSRNISLDILLKHLEKVTRLKYSIDSSRKRVLVSKA